MVWFNKLRYEPLYEIYDILSDKNKSILDKIIYYKDWEYKENLLSKLEINERNLNKYTVSIEDKINLYWNYWLLIINDLKTQIASPSLLELFKQNFNMITNIKKDSLLNISDNPALINLKNNSHFSNKLYMEIANKPIYHNNQWCILISYNYPINDNNSTDIIYSGKSFNEMWNTNNISLWYRNRINLQEQWKVFVNSQNKERTFSDNLKSGFKDIIGCFYSKWNIKNINLLNEELPKLSKRELNSISYLSNNLTVKDINDGKIANSK